MTCISTISGSSFRSAVETARCPTLSIPLGTLFELTAGLQRGGPQPDQRGQALGNELALGVEERRELLRPGLHAAHELGQLAAGRRGDELRPLDVVAHGQTLLRATRSRSPLNSANTRTPPTDPAGRLANKTLSGSPAAKTTALLAGTSRSIARAYSRSVRRTPAPGRQSSTTRRVRSSFTPIRTASSISARNRCESGEGGSAPRPSRNTCARCSGSVISSARPLSFASPGQAGGSSEPLCSAKRGSRCRSRALRARGIEPNHRSPSA